MTYTKNDIFEGMRFEVSGFTYEITNIRDIQCTLTRITDKVGDKWDDQNYIINSILTNLSSGDYKPIGQPEVVRNNYTIF